MPRRPTGSIVVDQRGGRVTYALRFTAGGKRRYETLDVSTREQAEVELANVLADVRRGRWHPPTPPAPVREPTAAPTFHEFGSEWLAGREAEGLAAKTITDLRWSLTNHLLPYFAELRLDEITPRTVDAYKVAKVQEREAIERERAAALKRGEKFSERGLSKGSINHTLVHLAAILETAVEYGLIESNPAAGKRRRLKAETPARPWVEPEQLMALLDATSGVGRVLLAILAGGGLRIGEALALRWQAIDLGTGTLYVKAAKTEKGIREVHLTPALREELTLWRADAKHTEPDDFVIHSSTGIKNNPSNLRRDVLTPAVAAANVTLEKAGISPIGHITFHSLRRTYASLRCACGDDVRYTADQLGHTDPRFTLRVYTQATKRPERMAKPQLAAFNKAREWAAMGSNGADDISAFTALETKNPA